MEIRDRIKLVMKVNQHTAASFADKLGVQRSSISHVLNGRNKPSLDFVQKILECFPRVDATWLITGKEPIKNVGQGDTSSKTSDDSDEKIIGALKEIKSAKTDKTIDRIVIFFSDRTFEHYDRE